MNDPFADAVENNIPPAESFEAAKETAPVTSAGVERVTVTLKGGAGYDAPWIVVKASSVGEADALVRELILAGLHTTVVKAAGVFNAGGPGQAGAGGGGGAAAPQSPAQPKGYPPGVEVQYCNHGPRNYVAKNNWAALFCSSPEGTPDHEKCDPLWRDKWGKFKAK